MFQLLSFRLASGISGQRANAFRSYGWLLPSFLHFAFLAHDYILNSKFFKKSFSVVVGLGDPRSSLLCVNDVEFASDKPFDAGFSMS